jgi:hypothetical protein
VKRDSASGIPHPYRNALFVLLVMAWLLPGLTGRDVWKSDEAETVGRVMQAMETGWKGVPHAPLFPWVAAKLAQPLAPWLPLIDSSRLATVLFSALALLFTGLAARELHGPGRGWPAALLLMSCFGLFLRGHGLFAEVSWLAGTAIFLYGTVLAGRRPSAGSVLMALGLAVTFFGQGPEAALGMLLLSLLPLTLPNWRNGRYLLALSIPFAVFGVAWITSDAAVQFETAHETLTKSAVYVPRLLVWFAWPLWPLALWTAWWERRRLSGNAEVWLPLLFMAGLLVLILFVPGDRELRTLPFLVPLTLLASAATGTLKRGAANGFYWFGAACFLFFVLVFWVYWAAMDLGWPEGLARHLRRLQPEYRAEIEWPFIGMGILACLFWLALLKFPRRDMARPVVVWASGMVLLWVLLIVLLKDWVQGGWGYGGMMREVAERIDALPGCVHAQGLSPALNAMLAYHAHIHPETSGAHCGWLLVQWDARQQTAPVVAAGWRPVREVFRPRDNQEKLILYARK